MRSGEGAAQQEDGLHVEARPGTGADAGLTHHGAQAGPCLVLLGENMQEGEVADLPPPVNNTPLLLLLLLQ